MHQGCIYLNQKYNKNSYIVHKYYGEILLRFKIAVFYFDILKYDFPVFGVT